MYLEGNLAFAIYAAIKSFLDNIAGRENLLFAQGISLQGIFWHGCLSGIYATVSVVLKGLAVYSCGPALLFLQLLQLPCGFLCAQHAGKSLFGAFAPEEKCVAVWFYRLGVSFVGALMGIVFTGIVGKVMGI